jgi:peptidoglycan hydrolase CwlO-like protein
MEVVSKSFLRGFGCCFILMLGLSHLDAKAALDASFYNSLFRSRQALLDQRQHLLESAAQLGTQIDALNRQLDTVNSYLRDTDKAIKDVEETMARVK